MLKERLSLGKESDVADLKEFGPAAENFDIGEITAAECENCQYKEYPSSLKIEDGKLWNSAPPIHAQILVATGKTDWVHNIGDEPSPFGEVCRELGAVSKDFEEIVGGNVRVNGTDMEWEEGDSKVTVIVLPQFIKVETTPEKCVEDVRAILQVKPGDTPPQGTKELKDKGFVLLCSHRTRDKRCGVTAPIMRDALVSELRQEDLFSDLNDDDDEGGIKLAFCNHVGGHKFAANVMIYKNDGTAVMFARIRPEHAHVIVQKAIIGNTIFPEYTRSCAKNAEYEW